MESLRELALGVRDRAYAPYSHFKVGAAIRATSGRIYLGANVENVAYPEGTCAEAGAIAAMCAGADYAIAEVYVVADSPHPVPCCGGCRQKIAEFAAPEVMITMATLGGESRVMRCAELLPRAFGAQHMVRAQGEKMPRP